MSTTNGPATSYAFDDCLQDCAPSEKWTWLEPWCSRRTTPARPFVDPHWVAPRPGSHCPATTSTSTTGCAGTSSTTGCTSSPGSGTCPCPAEFNYSIMASPLRLDDSILVALRER